MDTNTVITIDGPAGSGKTVCGRRAARTLGITFVSSGTFYRAVTVRALEDAIPFEDAHRVAALSEGLAIEWRSEGDRLVVLVDGRDRTDALKGPEATRNVGVVAENLAVRAVLARTLRALAAREPLFVEGRDMGTVVFPHAAVKFYITADLDRRTERRALELEALGLVVDRAVLRQDLEDRDRRDRERPHSPLRVPPGAITVDTSDLTIEESVEALVRAVEDHGGVRRLP